MHISLKLLAIVALTTLLMSCSCKKNSDGSDSCTLDVCNGVNLQGYVVFANGTSPTAGDDIVVQWSTDSFNTSINQLGVVNNSQGFPVVPFQFNYINCSTSSVELRAFQTTAGDDTWISGDVVGRDDGTSNGNATYIIENASSPPGAITISMDGTGAQ